MKDGRAGDRWDFCQRRVSRKIARLVKKLQLPPTYCATASFATYIFRTRLLLFPISLSLSLRRHTICFPRDFLVKTENSSECGRGKSRRESFPRFLVRFFTAFSFPTSRNSAPRMEMARCFGASLGINERHARRIARIYKSLNKSVSKYLYHTFLSQVLSRKLALPDTLARPSIQKLVVLVEVIISYVAIWRNLKRI